MSMKYKEEVWLFGKWGNNRFTALQHFNPELWTNEQVEEYAEEELFSNGGAYDIVYIVKDTGGDYDQIKILRDGSTND